MPTKNDCSCQQRMKFLKTFHQNFIVKKILKKNIFLNKLFLTNFSILIPKTYTFYFPKKMNIIKFKNQEFLGPRESGLFLAQNCDELIRIREDGIKAVAQMVYKYIYMFN